MLRSSNLPRIALLLCVVMLACLFLTLATRSVWVDEAMVLKAVIELKTPAEFFKPLAYYDQAEPMLASLFFKAILSLFHYNIEPLRLAVLVVSCLLISPMFLVFKRYRWGAVVFLLALIGHGFSTGMFVTELKHYFLEVCVSYLAIFAIWKAQERNNLYWPVIMAAVVSFMGFSTIMVSGGLLIYGCVMFVTQPRDETAIRKLSAFVVCGLVVGVAYLFMKSLTVYQLGNYDDYFASSAMGSLAILGHAVLGAYGKALLVISGIANIALLFSKNRGFLFKLNLFFLGLLCVVVVGRVVGFYPATYPRHVIWLAPFSLVIASYAILEFTANPTKTIKVLGWAMLMLLSLQAAKMGFNEFKGVNYEYVDNNDFYRHIADMEPTQFLVYPDAQPSLEYYSLLEPRLNKHQYVRVYDELTQKRDPTQGKVEYEDSIVQLLRHRPATDFSVLVSHVNLDTDITGRGKALVAEINRLNCTYTSYFYVYNAELIRVHCPMDAQL
ncbi:hypothetical protein [Pseudomonas sp.]|uniref:hypothetical protein n=1 Tax=Pseudomonas sp. TaxID=306 RepID=UPI00262720FC|nr:hypothetical protein [Pseudomonas sp.]